MNRKITALIAAFISILSIVIVTLFGIKAGMPATSIPVEDIMFVTFEGGTTENRITERFTRIESTREELAESMELYYYIFPANATNKEIDIGFNGFENNADKDKIDFSKIREGVILVDFKGYIFEKFEIIIRSKEKSSLSVRRTFSIVFKGEN